MSLLRPSYESLYPKFDELIVEYKYKFGLFYRFTQTQFHLLVYYHVYMLVGNIEHRMELALFLWSITHVGWNQTKILGQKHITPEAMDGYFLVQVGMCPCIMSHLRVW